MNVCVIVYFISTINMLAKHYLLYSTKYLELKYVKK